VNADVLRIPAGERRPGELTGLDQKLVILATVDNALIR
jgi:hypothetical protein